MFVFLRRSYFFIFLVVLVTKNSIFFCGEDENKLRKDRDLSITYYIEKVVEKVKNPYEDLEGFIFEIKKQKKIFPKDILQSLLDFKANSVSGFLLFNNLPVDEDLCETPESTFFFNEKKTVVSEILLITFSTILGEPFNYIQEENGNIFRNIKPTKKNAFKQTSDSSKADLELHTETAFHPFKPDYLLLYCLRGDRNKKAYTLISTLKDIIENLDPEVIEELKKPNYITGIDVSFGNPDRNQYVDEYIPVLYEASNKEDISGIMITYDLDLMRGLTQKSEEALETLTKTIKKVQKSILLEPGDLVILDNKRVVHGRTAYEPFFDGQDRWLQRVYVSTDKEFIENIPCFGRVVRRFF